MSEEASANPKLVRLAIIGGGVVGGGVVEMLALRRREFVDALGVDFQIRFVTVRDVSKPRDYALPDGVAFSADPLAAATSEDVDVVVECMGGTTDAKDAVLAALARGKHVVTANKALLSAHLPYVVDAAREGGAQLGFEAAVCGGIPIVKAMQRDVVADEVTAVSGILNGTTNYVLTRMEADGVGYADTVAEAQRLGYAEADPSADVDGLDARSKALLLAALAFGQRLFEEDIALRGIRELRSLDFDLLRPMGRTLRLAGACRRRKHALSLAVCPVVVPHGHALAQVAGPANRVVVQARCAGELAWTGAGAGQFPTATSIVSDLLAVAAGTAYRPFPRGLRSEGMPVERDVSGVFYVRAQTQSANAAAQVDAMAAEVGVLVQERLSRVQAAGAGAAAEQEVEGTVWAVMTQETTWEAVCVLVDNLVAAGFVASAGDVAFALSLE